MKLTSAAFKEGESIPSKYTCEGEDINPPLEIHDVPAGAKALVLIVDDPDVPSFVRKDNMWVHWVVFNIPPTTRTLAENSLAPGVQGKGTRGTLGYQGPCPPDREHRYFFKLYAIDALLSLKTGATKEDVTQAMQGHILAEAHLIARYDKRSRKG